MRTPGRSTIPRTKALSFRVGIGQGDMLVTPLQVADFIAAIGNGGTLYRPQLIDKITDIDGNVIQSFTPEVRGKLPVSQKTLDAVKEGMHMVVREQKGTAYKTFIGVNTPIYGKPEPPPPRWLSRMPGSPVLLMPNALISRISPSW